MANTGSDFLSCIGQPDNSVPLWHTASGLPPWIIGARLKANARPLVDEPLTSAHLQGIIALRLLTPRGTCLLL